MKLIDIYGRAVKIGMSMDLRSLKRVKAEQKDARAKFRALKGPEKKYFDTEKLVNPYADSRILNGPEDTEVKAIMVGIDVDVQEILLADRLREKGVRVDLVVSHHPSGRAYAQLDKVMALQSGVWETLGLDRDIAVGLMKKRIEEVARGISASNHTRARDAAKHLGIPFMCLHTVADNCVATYLQKLFDRKKPKTLDDVIRILLGIPEYRHSAKETGILPTILSGSGKKKAGRIFVDMTGGTNGPDNVMSRLSQSGVGTIVGMHIKESGYKTVTSEFLNYVVAGHISSDNLGMNILFDAIDRKKEFKFIECSGFKRFRR